MLRKFKNHYRDDFTLLTGYVRDSKNKDARREQLKQSVLEYCKAHGFLAVSKEFPFYLTALIFPKDAEDIIRHMMRSVSEHEKPMFQKVLRVLDLIKGIVKSYSEVRLKKISMIYEIKLLLDNFISMVKDGDIVVSGLVGSNEDLDQRYIKAILDSFQSLINVPRRPSSS